MKKIYLSLIIILAWSSFASGQYLQNGGFENWSTDIDGHLTPVSWYYPSHSGPIGYVSQDSGHTGNYCVRINSIFNGFHYGGGNLTSFPVPIIACPVSIQGYWKTNMDSVTDALTVNAYVYDSAGNNISTKIYNEGAGVSVPAWTHFTRNFSPCTGVPDIASISFFLPYYTGVNTYVEIDDLQLTFTIGIDEFSTILSSFSVSPTVSRGDINLKFSVTQSTNLKFEVYDLTGRKVSELLKDRFSFGVYSTPLHLDLNDGMYLLRAISDKGEKTIKFAVEH